MERCDICGTVTIRKPCNRQRTVHHLIPKWLRNKEDRKKTVILCRSCHRELHKWVDFSILEEKEYFIEKYHEYKEKFQKARQEFLTYKKGKEKWKGL